jgi:hypothetical protein
MNNQKNNNQTYIEFTGELKEKFDTLKKYYHTKNNTKLIKILIEEKEQQLSTNKPEATTNANQ